MSESRKGVYEWIAVAGGLAYLTLPLFILIPSLFPTLAMVPPLEGQRLAHFQALMAVVTPIGFIYLYAVARGLTSLTDMTVLWRLLWVGPWLAVSAALGAVELTGALFIAGLDVTLPIAAVALDKRGRGLIGRLREHFSMFSGRVSNRLLAAEALLGLALITGLAISRLLGPAPGYVESFAIAVFGCHQLLLLWTAGSSDDRAHAFALIVRMLGLGSLVAMLMFGFPRADLLPIAALLILGGWTHAYARAYEAAFAMGVSPSAWVVTGSLGVIGSSFLWSLGIPWFGGNAAILAVNIHRQDLIIGGFAVLVGAALAQVRAQAPLHARLVAWLLPFSAVWFTVETKLLAHWGSGTPFHPSWAARGLAPVWGGNPVVDFTFFGATLFMTAISTTYTALVLLRFLPRAGWGSLVWHGVGVILVSALWMIASSSGLPTPFQFLAETGTIPPLLPADPIRCVDVHVRDLLIGCLMMGAGFALPAAFPAPGGAPRFAVIAAWGLSISAKLLTHAIALGWIAEKA